MLETSSNSLNFFEAKKSLELLDQLQLDYKYYLMNITKITNSDYDKCVEEVRSKQCVNIDGWKEAIIEIKEQLNYTLTQTLPYIKSQIESKKSALTQVQELIEAKNKSHSKERKKFEQFLTTTSNTLETLNQLYNFTAMKELYSEVKDSIKKGDQIQFLQTAQKIQQETNHIRRKLAQKKQQQLHLQQLPDTASNKFTSFLDLQADTSMFKEEQNRKGQTIYSYFKELKAILAQSIEQLDNAYNIRISLLNSEENLLRREITHLQDVVSKSDKDIERVENLQKKYKNNIQRCNNSPKDIEQDCGIINIKAKEANFEINQIVQKIIILKKEVLKLLEIKKK